MNDGPASGLRIALVGPAAPWRGGIAQHVDGTAAVLAARGHELRILSFSRQYPGVLFPGRSQRESGREAAPWTCLELDSINPVSWWRSGRRLARWAPRVVVPSYWLPFFVPAYAGVLAALDRARTCVVFDCHNIRPHERRVGDGLLTRWMLNLPDGIIVHSESVERTLRELKPGLPTRVVPLPSAHGFPDGPGRVRARAALGIDPDRSVLLFFGFVRAYKGLDVLIRSLDRLDEHVHVLVAGELYDDADSHRRSAARHGPRVRLVDRYVPTGEVGTYFDAADLVVLPYRRATQSGVVPLAMRFGVPVVSTRVGGLAEHVVEGENGFLVAPDDPAALADAITRALDAETLARLREGVGRVAAGLSWERMTEAIESFV